MSEKDRRDPGHPGKGRQRLDAVPARPDERLAAALEELEVTQTHLAHSEKLASIGQLAAGVAHEINNPIGYISSNLNSLGQYVRDIKRVVVAYGDLVEAFGRGAPDVLERAEAVRQLQDEIDLEYILTDVADLVGESVEGANRVRQIVADLRDFAHVDSPNVAAHDVNDLIDRTINVAWNELKYKADLVREYGEIPPLPCYGGKLGQLFLNLLVNAAQAIPERGTITVRTGHEGGTVWIDVEDTGCGMSAEVTDRIFEPFFTTKKASKGTGLGLHLAYKIVEAHGGRISVRTAPGSGATFRVELPTSGPPRAQESPDELAA